MFAACSAKIVLSEQEYYDLATKGMEKKAYDIAIQDYQRLLEEYPSATTARKRS